MLDYSLARATGPAVEPVTLSEAKKHANVVATDDDTYISALITAARELVETDANRSLITQTWRLKLHQFPSGACIHLPRPPLVSVSSITYYDQNDTEQTWGATNYIVDGDREPGVIWLDEDSQWPTTRAGKPNAVTVTYVAGYGAEPSAVPARAKHAILLLVGHWYATREPVTIGAVGQEIALAYDALIKSLRPGNYP